MESCWQSTREKQGSKKAGGERTTPLMAVRSESETISVNKGKWNNQELCELETTEIDE